MKRFITHFVAILTIAVFGASAHADLVWVGAGGGFGGNSISLYAENNWQEDDGTVADANEIDPGVTVTAGTGGVIRIDSGTGQPSNYGGGDFSIGSNDLIVGGGKLLRSPSFGIAGTAGSSITVTGGGTIEVVEITGVNGGISVDGGTLITSGTTEINTSGTGLDVLNNGTVSILGFRNNGTASEWNSGSITLGDANPLRTNSAVSPTNSINITADAGALTVTHTDLSGGYTNADIADKLNLGFFRLDGVHVDPDDNGFATPLASEADVAALNTFLEINYTVNQKTLFLSDNSGGERTLSVVAVPETLTINSTEPVDNVILSNTGNNSFTRSFDDQEARGQSLLTPDTGDANSQYLVSELVLQKNANQTFIAGDMVRLWVFEWNPDDDSNDFSNWTAGDGLGDGDLFDGTGISNVLLDHVFHLPVGEIANGEFLHFEFNENALVMDENAAYGFHLEFIDADATDTGARFLQLAIPASGSSSYADGRLLTNFNTTSNGTNASQDLVFYLVGEAIPTPAALPAGLVMMIAVAARRRRK